MENASTNDDKTEGHLETNPWKIRHGSSER